MESKVSLKDRIRRTRSSIFALGSQKPATTTEKSNKNPYFRGPPNQNRSPSPRVDRQFIPKELERELKYACYRLQRNIERGIPSIDISQKPEPTTDNPAPAELPTNHQPRLQSSSMPPTLRGRNAPGLLSGDRPYGKHEFDTEPWHRWSGLVMPDTEACSGSSRIPSSTKSTRDAAAQDMPFSSGETLVANDKHGPQDRRPNARVPADIEDDPHTETLYENEPSPTIHNVAPSLSRPAVESRLVRKRRFENLHDESVRESLSHRQSSTNNRLSNTVPAPRARYSWLPKTGIRPASTIELGASCRRQAAEGSVIVDSNGVRHTITAAEEETRQNDLQRAVKEKMSTGRIRPSTMAFGSTTNKTGRRSASTPLTCLDSSHEKKKQPSAPVPGSGPGNGLHAKDATTGTFQPTKRKYILQKLSFLGFGRQKNKDTLGFSRIVEAA